MSNAVFLLFVFMFCSFLCLCDQPARPQQTFLRSFRGSAEKGHGRFPISFGSCGGASAPPDEGHDLAPGAGGVRAEGGCAGALGDPMFHRPEHRAVIIGLRRHIGKGHILRLRRRTSGGPPKEGDRLCAGADAVWRKMRGVHAGGDAVFHGPIHGFPEIALLRYIHKPAAGRFLRLFRGLWPNGGQAASGCSAGLYAADRSGSYAA